MLKVDFAGSEKAHQARLNKLCFVIDGLLPVDLSDRKNAIDALVKVAIRYEHNLLTGAPPHNMPSTFHKIEQQLSKELASMARCLKKLDELFEQAGGFTHETIAEDLKKKGVDLDAFGRALTAFHEVAVEYSKPPQKMKQGNHTSAVGLYTRALWACLRRLDIGGMRQGGRIVANLLIATVPKYHGYDSKELAESCYQIIREKEAR